MIQQIREAFERCQQRFPTVCLSIEAFQARIEEILSEICAAGHEARREAFGKIHHEDLFLAIACAQEDRIAWEHFADEYVPLLRRFSAQACRNSGEAEDLAQEITMRLLQEKRRLAGYNGRGSLAGWLRVAVSHAAIDRFRRASRQTSLEGLEENGVGPPVVDSRKSDEEDLDSRWAPIVTGIADECLRGLPARDRLLLCLHYLQGVPLRDIGRQFGVSEATAYRWLDRMRRDIRKKVERELRKKHGLRASEIQSLWKWVLPSSLDSIAGSSPQTGTHATARKKTAIGENSSVINEEELR